jgi:hypothetical protein
MKIKNIKDGRIIDVEKNANGTYTIDGKEIQANDMKNDWVVVKPVAKKVEPKDPMIVESNTEIGGDIGGLAGALASCQGEFTAVKKGKEGHGYNYADIEAVLKASSPITSKYGISIIQMNLSKIVGDMLFTGVKTIIAHKSGGYVSSEIFMPTVKTKMNSIVQMAGVNITYLRRYGIQSALGLATTDNDGRDD